MEPYPPLPTSLVAETENTFSASTTTSTAPASTAAVTSPPNDVPQQPIALASASTAPMPVLGDSFPRTSRNRSATLAQNMNVEQILPGLRRLAVQASRGEITEQERQSLRSELIASLASPDGWRESELIGYTKHHRRREANAGIDEKKGDDLEESSDESSSDDEDGQSEPNSPTPLTSATSSSVSSSSLSSPSTNSLPNLSPSSSASSLLPSSSSTSSSFAAASSSSSSSPPSSSTPATATATVQTSASSPNLLTTATSSSSASSTPSPTLTSAALTSLAVAAARTGPGLPRAASYAPFGESASARPTTVSVVAGSSADDENDGFKFVMLSSNLCRALTPVQYGGGFVTIKFPDGATRADLKRLVLQRFANEPGAKTRTREKSPSPNSPTSTSSSTSSTSSSVKVDTSSSSSEHKSSKTSSPRRKKMMHRMPPGPPIPVMDPEEFYYNQIIGQGGYATVLRATHKKTNQVYAIKIVRKSSVHAKKTRMYLERNILGLLDSPFIVKIHGFFEDKTFMAHVLQLVTGGSFYDVEKRLRGGMFSSPKGLPEPLVCFYAAELCVALEAMHNRGVVFRDLKPDNILLDADGHLMIIDMGVAYMANEDRKLSVDFDARKLARCTTIVGAHGFRAPEMFDKHGKYGVSVDWWNYGLILYLLLSGKHPLEHSSRWKAAMVGLANRDREAAAAEKLVIKPLKRVSANATDLVEKLLDRDPLTRIGSVDDADEIMAHPFFKDLNWERIRTRADPPPIDSKYTKAAKMDSGPSQPIHSYKEVLQSISIWEDDLISGM